MILALLLGLTSVPTIALDERSALVMVVLSKDGNEAGERVFFDSAARALYGRVPVRLTSPDDWNINLRRMNSCAADVRLICWASAARPDFDLETRDYQAHLRRLRAEGKPWARWLLAVTAVRTSAGQLHVSAALIDTDDAFEKWVREERSPEFERRVDAAVFRATPSFTGQATEADLDHLFDELVSTFLPHLQARGEVEPLFGSVRVRGAEPGAAIVLDHRTVGRVPDPSFELTGIRAGARHLEIRSEERSIAISLAVSPGQTVDANIPEPEVEEVLRPTLRWTGAALVVLGAAGLTWALVNASDGIVEACLVRNLAEAGCASLGSPGFGYSAPAVATTNPEEVDPSGVGPASVGLGLLAAGSALSLGPAFVDAPWWLHLAGSTLLGAVAFGAFALLD